MRTTSSLESYNCVLGKKIMKKGHFFRFIQKIQEEEFHKSVFFQQMLEKGGSCSGPKKKNLE